MKFELKTENEHYSKLFENVFRVVFYLLLIFISCDIAFKLKNISRHYQIDLNCNLLSVEKSTPIFKKLSRFTNIKSRQKIWEFCREFVK